VPPSPPFSPAAITPRAFRLGRADLAGFSAAAAGLLEAYDWPGNVRELRNAVERAVALSPGGEVGAEDLPDPVRRSALAGAPVVLPPLRRRQDELEVERIREALRRHNEGRSRAARELGISRVALWKKLRKYGLAGGPSHGGGPSPLAAEVA
jgi:DNA-binding NtrC family response regulator